MQPQGAWSGGVWGMKTISSPTIVLKDGEEACTICHERPLEICLLPCKHRFCGECVTCLRKANVFKADAGIKCPLCRTFAEGFAPLKEGLLDDSLVEANRAARAAAAARLPVKQTMQKDVRGPAALEAKSKWKCAGCGESHYHTYMKCAKCGTWKPPEANLTVNKQDVLKCNDKEIRLLAEQKFYPGLKQAFEEAGIHETETGPCVGTPESVIAAVKKRGSPERLHYVIKLLTGHGHVKELVTEFFGNYTLQDLLGAAQAFRLAAARLKEEGGTSQSALDKLVGMRDGSDCLVQLAVGITEAMPQGVLHAQGNFVVLKLLDVADPIDCMPLAGALLPEAIEITEPKNGQFHGLEIMLKLVFKIGQLATQVSHMKAGAQQVLDSLCGIYLRKPDKVANLARHLLGGQILVEAAFVALPRAHGMKLLCDLAGMGLHLLNSGRGGLNTLVCMASCTSSDPEVMETITTAVCILASQLEKDFVTAMTKYHAAANPTDGAELIWKMLQILEKGNEESWVHTIIDKVMGGIGNFQGKRHAMEKIPLMLSMVSVAPTTLQGYIQKVKCCLPEEEVWQMQGIIASRRRLLQKKQPRPTQAVNGPHTPQTAAPEQALRFGDFEQSDGTGSHASPPRAAPPAQAPPPKQLPGPVIQPRAQGSAPGQPPAQQKVMAAQGPPHASPPCPYQQAPPQQQQQQMQPQLQQRPYHIVTPAAPRPPSHPPGLAVPPPQAPMKLTPCSVPPGARPIAAAKRPPYQPVQPGKQGELSNLAALLPHLMMRSHVPPPPTQGPPSQPHGAQNGLPTSHAPQRPPAQAPPAAARPPQAAHRAAQNPAQNPLPAPRTTQPLPNGVPQRGASSQHTPSTHPAAVAPPQARPGNAANGPRVDTAPAETGGWMCKMCTYNHVGPEANFLCCAMCESQRQD